MASLKFAVQSVIRDCLGVRRNEEVLILCDKAQNNVGRLFWDALPSFTSRTFFLEIPPLCHPGHQLSNGLVAFMIQFDAVLMVTSRSLFHSNARRKAASHGGRILSLGGVTPESLVRTLTGRYQTVVEKSRKIADIFSIGRQARLTTPAGTDLIFSIMRMRGYADTGMALEPGQAANIPGGEGCVSPLPDSTDGTLVIDGSFPEIGALTQPLVLTIKHGCIHRIVGGKDAEKLRRLFLIFGKPAKTVAELGIGTNPFAVLTGTTLEDEKVLGTAHVAFGNNLSFEGKVGVHCHLDGIVLNPTLTIDGKTIVEKGEIKV
jgi:leucyl aminopeptidase (aminopeptidase T)